MKVVYILLTNTESILSSSIRLFTNDPYNHVSLVLNEEFTEIYSFGRLKKDNPVIGGFVNEFETKIYSAINKMREGIYNKNKNHCKSCYFSNKNNCVID